MDYPLWEDRLLAAGVKTVMTQADVNSPKQEAPAEKEKGEELMDGIRADIRRLNTFSSRGLWALSLFMFICMMAWNGFSMLPTPDAIVSTLGRPPTPQIISILLLIYTFSAIILSLSRMMGGIEHKSSFCHVGYLTGFFLFYYVSKGLSDNYWAVFGAGITILGVESYRIWTFCNEAITKKTEQLQYVQRTGRMPAADD